MFSAKIKTDVEIPPASRRSKDRLKTIKRYNNRPESLLREAVDDGDMWCLYQLLSGDKLADNKDACNEALVRASNRGRKDMMQLLLDCGADINTSGGEVLVNAVRQNYGIEVAEFVVEKGVDLEKYGAKALRHASEYNRMDTAIFLLEKGVEPRGAAEALLIHALRNDDEKLIETLKEKGVDIRKIGAQPLQQLAGNGDAKGVRFLLDHGVSPEHKGFAPLYQAIRNGNSEVADLIYTRCADRFDTQRVLDQSLEKGNTVEMRWALKHGATLRKAPEEALNAVVDGANVKTLRFLNADHGLEISPEKMVERALANDSTEFMELALEHGAQALDLDALLKTAVEKRKNTVAEFLLEKGADIAQDKGALLPAIIDNADMDFLKKIVAAGVDLTRNRGEALLKAAHSNRNETVDYLLAHETNWPAKAVNDALDQSRDNKVRASLSDYRKRIASGWELGNDFEISREQKYGSGDSIRRIFNFRSCQVTTIVSKNDPPHMNVTHRDFKDYQSDGEIREAFAKLQRLSSNPPEYSGKDFTPYAAKKKGDAGGGMRIK